jgi:hypothetical protein
VVGRNRSTASRQQGLGFENHDRAADAPGKGSGGEAHRGGGVTSGQSGGSVRWCAAVSS